MSNSYVRFRFPSFLEDVMRGLDDPKAMFSLMSLEIFNHFAGKYETIIYKLCKDYVGVSRTPSMSLEAFREYMGIRPTEYPEFKKLNARVISEPVRRINGSDISDILVSPEFCREGRKVTSLFFRIENKKQTSLPLPIAGEDGAFGLAKLPVPPALQAKYLAMRPQSDIQACIERANEYGAQQERQGKDVNYGGLYRRAIEEGWHQQAAASAEKRGRVRAKRASTDLEDAAQRKSDADRANNDRARRAAALQAFAGLSESEQQAMERAYLDQATAPERTVFGKLGRNAPAFSIYVRGKLGTGE